MELTVWFEGVPRVVCGATPATSCHEVIIALAQAASLTGRYTLVEVFRGSERALAPEESPLLSLAKFGDKDKEVQFKLMRRDSVPSPSNKLSTKQGQSHQKLNSSMSPVPHQPMDRPIADEELCQKLKDHLAYQEQEIEYNRIKLLQLDKSIGNLELCSVVDDSDAEAKILAQRSELSQLQSVDWNQLLQKERTHAATLKVEKTNWENRVREADLRLSSAKEQLKLLEEELAIERERQLAHLELANQKRRERLNQLESEYQNLNSKSHRFMENRPSSSEGGGQHHSGLWV